MLQLEIAGAGAGAGPIEVELFAIGGQRFPLRRPVVATGGRLQVEVGNGIPPGVYWSVATQSGQRATRKVVVLP